MRQCQGGRACTQPRPGGTHRPRRRRSSRASGRHQAPPVPPLATLPGNGTRELTRPTQGTQAATQTGPGSPPRHGGKAAEAGDCSAVELGGRPARRPYKHGNCIVRKQKIASTLPINLQQRGKTTQPAHTCAWLCIQGTHCRARLGAGDSGYTAVCSLDTNNTFISLPWDVRRSRGHGQPTLGRVACSSVKRVTLTSLSPGQLGEGPSAPRRRRALLLPGTAGRQRYTSASWCCGLSGHGGMSRTLGTADEAQLLSP